MGVKQSDIDYLLQYLGHNKGVVDEYYLKLEENLSHEFNAVFQVLQRKYDSLRGAVKAKYEESVREINEKMEKLMGQQKILENLKEIDLKDLETNVKFYQTY